MGSAVDVAAAVGLAVPARQSRCRRGWRRASFDLVGFSLVAAVSPQVPPLVNMRSMQ
jgi:hypothetical protein